jgi:hypothetical protein
MTDPTVSWAASNKVVERTISLTANIPNRARGQQDPNPVALPKGIGTSADPVLAMRFLPR